MGACWRSLTLGLHFCPVIVRQCFVALVSPKRVGAVRVGAFLSVMSGGVRVMYTVFGWSVVIAGSFVVMTMVTSTSMSTSSSTSLSTRAGSLVPSTPSTSTSTSLSTIVSTIGVLVVCNHVGLSCVYVGQIQFSERFRVGSDH